jgi:WD40 repeat protein
MRSFDAGNLDDPTSSYKLLKHNIHMDGQFARSSGILHKVGSVSFSDDGKRLITGDNDGYIHMWDTDSDSENFGKLFINSDTRLSSMAAHPDALQKVAAMNHRSIYGGGIRSLSFSSDGKRFASGSGSSTVCIWSADPANEKYVYGTNEWDPEYYQFRKTLRGHTGGVNSVSFSPDNKRLASGSDDKTIRLWNVDRDILNSKVKDSYGTCVRILESHTRPVTSVSFSPDKTRLASGSEDGTIRLWDVDGLSDSGNYGERIQTIEKKTITIGGGYSVSSVNSVSFSPDNTRLVSGSEDGSVRVWDFKMGSLLFGTEKTLSGHTGSVKSVSFSSDGKLIVSGSLDSTVRVWDALEMSEGNRISGLRNDRYLELENIHLRF